MSSHLWESLIAKFHCVNVFKKKKEVAGKNSGDNDEFCYEICFRVRI